MNPQEITPNKYSGEFETETFQIPRPSDSKKNQHIEGTGIFKIKNPRPLYEPFIYYHCCPKKFGKPKNIVQQYS